MKPYNIYKKYDNNIPQRGSVAKKAKDTGTAPTKYKNQSSFFCVCIISKLLYVWCVF